MSPKQRILANRTTADEIKAMVNRSAFERATEAALHEFVMGQSRASEGASAVGSHFEIEGAKRFLSLLSHIADAPTAHTPKQFGQLDHEMKPPEKK